MFVAAAGSLTLMTNMDVLSKYPWTLLCSSDSNEIVVLWASTVLLSPLCPLSLSPPSLPPFNLGIGCSLQVHQVLYISHQLWSYLHFAAHLLSIQMTCVKNK